MLEKIKMQGQRMSAMAQVESHQRNAEFVVKQELRQSRTVAYSTPASATVEFQSIIGEAAADRAKAEKAERKAGMIATLKHHIDTFNRDTYIPDLTVSLHALCHEIRQDYPEAVGIRAALADATKFGKSREIVETMETALGWMEEL